MPEYAFPLLNKQELISTLGELDIQVTNDDLLNPAGWKVKQVYEQLVELMLCMRREDIQQGPFEALEELEHRELHDESVPMIGFLRATNKLLSISGITDFCLQDVTQPTKDRLRQHLSAVINFAKFREDRQAGYVQFTEETDNLLTKRANLEEENESLLAQHHQAKAQAEQEEPQRTALHESNLKLGDEVRTLFNQQTEVHNECASLKEQLHAVQDEIREARLQLDDAQRERDRLKSEIVPDPRGLKTKLTELTESSSAEKAAIKALENQIAQHAIRREALERTEREVDEVLDAQAEVEAEQNKLRDMKKQLKENAEAASREDVKKNDELFQLKGLDKRKQDKSEQIKRLAEQHSSKRNIASDAHADTRRRWSLLEHERSDQGRMLEANETQLRTLRDELLRGKMEHEAEVASVQQQQQLLAAQVRAYHQDLLNAMKQVTGSNAVLCS